MNSDGYGDTQQVTTYGTSRPRTRRLDDGRTITYYDQSYSDI
ncbi:hypothetical protein [Staphylococcus warneri]